MDGFSVGRRSLIEHVCPSPHRRGSLAARWRQIGLPLRLRGRRSAAKALATGMVAALALASALPARALVPYVYVPDSKDLEAAGLGIAQASARLLRFGQAEEAGRLAELTVRLLPDDPRGWVLLAEAQLRKIGRAHV
mgnify:FL=1